MITDAVLWVSHPAMMLERLGGLTILERQLFTLSRSGVRRVWVAAQKPRGQAMNRLRYPDGLEIIWVTMVGDAPSECSPPYLGLSGDHLVRESALKSALSEEHVRHTSYQDPAGHGIIQVIPYRSDGLIRFDAKPMPAGTFVPLQTPPDLGPALPWLLQGASKSSDGFMARVFDRHISLAVTRRLLDWPVTPNMMTFFSTLIGLAGTLLMTVGTRERMVEGAALVWLHTLLDGCDGEIARIKFLESPLGGTMDFWGDNLVHMSLFICLGIGVSPLHARPVFLALGAVAAASVFASALLVFRHSARRAAAKAAGPLFDGIAGMVRPEAAGSRLSRLETMLAQRDFIYLLVPLAAAGRLKEFLWAAAIGTPMFFLILLYLKRDDAWRQPT